MDVRDLHKFEQASFCGAYSILLFDYFVEHEQALRELARVIAPGGMFFTHIGSHRIAPGLEPPKSYGEIDAQETFEYLPEGHGLLNIRVGRDWLIDAIRRSGFDPVHVYVEDVPTGNEYEWFVGRRQPDAIVRAGQATALGQGRDPLAAALLRILPPRSRSRGAQRPRGLRTSWSTRCRSIPPSASRAWWFASRFRTAPGPDASESTSGTRPSRRPRRP